MGLTDQSYWCANCLEHRTECLLCGPNGGKVERVPYHILEKWREEDERHNYKRNYR